MPTELLLILDKYGDNAVSNTTCSDWFRRFKNHNFNLEFKELSGDEELEALLASIQFSSLVDCIAFDEIIQIAL